MKNTTTTTSDMTNLDLLTEVLKDFCKKYNLDFQSADDILWSDQKYYDGEPQVKLTTYQKDWLVNYISVWDVIAAA